MIRLILARHGNTFETGQTPVQVGARTDLSLTAQGRQQAEQFAKHLAAKAISPAAIYAGALKRQVEFAQIVAERLCIKDRLQLGERALTEIDYGDWEGLTAEEMARRWPQPYADWTEEGRWPEEIFGGREQGHLREIDRWLAHLRSAHAPGDAVVGITSNGAIRFFYSLQCEKWRQLVAARQMETLKVKTGHFCELLLLPESFTVKAWNVRPFESRS